MSATATMAPSAALSPRTHSLLHGAIIPTLLSMAWPNILVMLAQASTGLIETWFVSRLGTDALAGMAVVGTNVLIMAVLGAYLLMGRALVRPRLVRPRWPLFAGLLRLSPELFGRLPQRGMRRAFGRRAAGGLQRRRV